MESSAKHDSLVLKECLLRLENGDEEAREELVGRFMGRFESLARRMMSRFPVVQRWEQTGDVLQNALLRLVKALGSLQPNDTRHFLALAATQIRRELIDLARRYRGPQGAGAHHESVFGAEDSSPAAAMLDGWDKSQEPSGLAEWGELHEYIAGLPDVERETCELLWYQDLTQRDAAELLGVSERTVKRRWQEVRLKLHGFLRESGE